MPPFGPPRFRYDYDLATEKKRVDAFFDDPDRGIPRKRKNDFDLASWNIANLGNQKRRDKDLELIAHILSKFDMTAVQEVNANLGHFNKIMKILAKQKYDMRLSDVAGNQERLAVVFDTQRVRPRQLFGELDYNPAGKVRRGKYVISPKKQTLRFEGETLDLPFYNFNRNPYLSTWKIVGRKTTFLLANVHIFFGAEEKKSKPKFENRIAEVYFMANWAREQQTAKKRANLYESNIILIGDMNIPRMSSKDKVYKALARRGMRPSRWSTEAGTTIQEFKSFDQIVFTNDALKVRKIRNRTAVVVDFDNFVFEELWKDPRRDLADFKRWTRFAISDHRPIFVRLEV